MDYNLFMGGYDFMVVLWIIFIVVGVLRIKDDYKEYLNKRLNGDFYRNQTEYVYRESP